MTELAILSIIAYHASVAKIDVTEAFRIAKCESSLNYQAKNLNSSAKGLYQFIDKTWKWACTGDVYNPIDNVKCFTKLYKKYPNYWVCK